MRTWHEVRKFTSQKFRLTPETSRAKFFRFWLCSCFLL